MARDALIEVGEGGVPEALNKLWGRLLEEGLVDALLIPKELPLGSNVVQTLITSPDKLQLTNPLAPVLPVSSARIISTITKVAPSQRKIGVVTWF
jgi:hypothetical protein